MEYLDIPDFLKFDIYASISHTDILDIPDFLDLGFGKLELCEK